MAEVQTVEEFLAFVNSHVTVGGDYWFRGHASEGWDLSASVFRTASRAQSEKVLLKRFMQEARRHIAEVPSEEWEWVFLAQHHQVPTRLLDWSESPLVALFFAALDHLDIAGDDKTARVGRVWLLQPTVMNAKLGFSFGPRDIPLFGLDDVFDDYSPFRGVPHAKPPVAGLATRSFGRITAQWGTFTVCNTGAPIDLLAARDEFLAHVDVPVAAKSGIRQQLAQLGLDERTIYLDLYRLGQRLTEVFAP